MIAKKIKVLGAGMAISLALTGAGFAAWNTTVSATSNLNTGKFDIKVTEATAGTAETITGQPANQVLIAPATKPDDKDAVFAFNNLYPNVVLKDNTFTVSNLGTYSAKITGVEVATGTTPASELSQVKAFGTVTIAGNVIATISKDEAVTLDKLQAALDSKLKDKEIPINDTAITNLNFISQDGLGQDKAITVAVKYNADIK
jgi:hypothetical protein